jgi:hypothetical protein
MKNRPTHFAIVENRSENQRNRIEMERLYFRNMGLHIWHGHA